MQQTNYMKLVWLAAFIGFAGISCWATAESLHMLLSSLPLVVCYILSIGFFIIASLGTKMIVDSCNQNIFLEHRGSRLWGGVVIVLIFWLVCSMPTNTHTFFFRTAIDNITNNDIRTTRGYLSQVENNAQNRVQQAEQKVQQLEQDAQVLITSLLNEIKSPTSKGDGKHAERIREDIAKFFGIENFYISSKAQTTQEVAELCELYQSLFNEHLQQKKLELQRTITFPNQRHINMAITAGNNLDKLADLIQKKEVVLTDADDIRDPVDARLQDGYNAVKLNKEFVNFATPTDQMTYTAENPTTKVMRMLSVFKVWKEFFQGKFAGYEFLLWILISILVDVAAFVFFNLAFKRQTTNFISPSSPF